MQTQAPTVRVNRRNPHLARLDRQIKRRGEAIELIFIVGSTTQTRQRANVRGIVRTLGREQVIAGFTETKYLVVISPNDLRRARVHHISKLSEHRVPFIEDLLSQFRIFLRALLLKIKLLVQQFLLKAIRKLSGEPGTDHGPDQGGKDR